MMITEEKLEYCNNEEIRGEYSQELLIFDISSPF